VAAIAIVVFVVLVASDVVALAPQYLGGRSVHILFLGSSIVAAATVVVAATVVLSAKDGPDSIPNARA
jgi:hypothetical protein